MMEEDVHETMRQHNLTYRRTLDQMEAKYAKLMKKDGGGIDVNLNRAKIRDLEHYMAVSEKDVSEVALEMKLQAEETNESIESNSTMDGVSEMEQTQDSSDLLDDTQGILTEGSVQDQDRVLDRTLIVPCSAGWLWKYRRMRRRMRQTNANARKTTKPAPRGDRHYPRRSCDVHPPKAAVQGIATVFHSPARRRSDWPEPLQGASPRKEVDPARREQQQWPSSLHKHPPLSSGVSEMEQTQDPVDLLDDTQGNLTEALVQDGVLDRIRSSPGSTRSLWRYRRMRRTNANARKTPTNPHPAPRGDCHSPLRSRDIHPPKAAVKGIVTVFHSPARRHSDWPEPLQGRQASPRKEVDPARREQQQWPVRVMDFNLVGFPREDKQARYNGASPSSLHKHPPLSSGVSEMEQTQEPVDLLDDTQGNLTEALVQDGVLDRIRSSPGSTRSLWRYRRMRRTNANARKTPTNPHPAPRGDCHSPLRSRDIHPPKAAVKGIVTVFHSAARRHSDWPEPLQGRQASPRKEVGGARKEVDPARREQQRPVRGMDFNLPEPSQASMNQIFTVSKGSPHCSPLSGRLQRQSSSPAVRSPAQTPRSNRSDEPRVMESSTVPNSPVRQQGSFKTKWRNQEGYGGSIDAFARCSDSDFREAKKARYNGASPPSLHTHPPVSPRRTLYHQDCHSPSLLRSDSPRSSSATGSHSFQQHHSSALPPFLASRGRLEDEFTKYYHKYICLAKSSPSDHRSCHCCATRLQASRGSASSSSASALSALALSPHRSVLRKRVRELGQDMSLQSKRLRECNPSPGSLRHRVEKLRLSRSSSVPLTSTRLESPEKNTYQSRARASLKFSNHSPLWRGRREPRPDRSQQW